MPRGYYITAEFLVLWVLQSLLHNFPCALDVGIDLYMYLFGLDNPEIRHPAANNSQYSDQL